MIKVVSIFCGAGGMDLGLQLAEGFEILAAYDYWRPALDTYNLNLGKATFMDLSKDLPCHDRVDVLVGGPPCTSFCKAGKNLGLNDKNGRMLLRYVEAVKHLRPKMFVFENVENLTKEHAVVFAEFLGMLKALSYRVFQKTLVATDYGVPQTRRRVIVVGSLDSSSEPFQFPMPTVDKPMTLWEAIGHLPVVLKDDSPLGFPQHDRQREHHYVYFPNSRTERQDYRRRFKPSEPSPTICADMHNSQLHPFTDRHLTVREVALIQSFPPWFLFCGTCVKENFQLIANAVPSPMAAEIAKAVKLYFEQVWMR